MMDGWMDGFCLPFKKLSTVKTIAKCGSPAPAVYFPYKHQLSLYPLQLLLFFIPINLTFLPFLTMQPAEVAELCYTTTLANPTPSYPISLTMTHNNLPNVVQITRFLNPLHDFQIPSIQEFSLACISANNNKADEQQVSIVDERKQRRMISNRESARRSRMRKQKHLDELWSQVLRLRTENRQLIDKLNNASDSHERVVRENSCLREEASELRRMLQEVQVNNTNNSFRGLQVPCNTAHLQAESSNQAIASSMDLLH